MDVVRGTVRFPRELLGHVSGTLHKGQELFNLKLAKMLPDEAKIRYLEYHLDKSCLQVILRLVKLVTQLLALGCVVCEKDQQRNEKDHVIHGTTAF